MKLINKTFRYFILTALYLMAHSQALFAQPANDDCATAQPVTIPSSGVVCISGTTTNATSNGTTNGCDVAPAGNEVWFTYVATGAQNDITVTPVGGTPISDIVVTTYTGGCDGLFIEGCESETGATPTTESSGLTPGTQVWIGVESNGTDGDFEICIQSTTPQGDPGNTCADAEALCRKEPFSYGTLTNYSSSGFRPTCFTSAVQRDIWFKFTVGQTGSLEWAAFPNQAQEFDWALYDITNGCPNNGTTPVACNYNYSQPAVGSAQNPIGMGPAQGGGDPGEFSPAVNVVAGRTYALVIDNYSGNNGGFDFTWGGTFKMAPFADFDLDPLHACNRLTTTVTNNSYGADNYLWSFGDGNSSNLENPPTLVYPDPGNYIVSLTATTNEGCLHTVTKVAVVSAPLVELTSNKDSICLGDDVTLTGDVSFTALQNPIPFTVVEDENINDNDPAGLESKIDVAGVFPTTINPGEGEIMFVNLSIHHTRTQDLDITLTCPNGTSIDLSSDNGGNGDNYENTTFETGAAAITGGTAPFTGSYAPEQPFSTLNGCPVNGQWTLKVVDDQGGQAPYFDEWTIAFKNENSVSYQWLPLSDFPDQSAFSHTFSPTETKTYTLEATDALGCVEFVDVEVVVEEPKDAGLDSTLAVCSGDGTLDLSGLLRNANSADGIYLDPNGTEILPTLDLASAPSGTYSYVLAGKHCPDDQADFFITINPSPDASIAQDSSVCEGEVVDVTITATAGVAPFSTTININGTDSILTMAGASETLSFTVDQLLNIDLVRIAESSSPPCITELSESVKLEPFAPLTAEVVDMICSADNTTYQLIINISGGDPGTYTVNTLPATANYTSPSIPNGGDYSFVVTDINNCDPVLLEGKEFCACISDAGTMDQNPLDICPGETAIAPENNDTTLEANDVVRYILHDSPTEAIGTIYAWNTAPNFGFGPGMNYGETYYISRIIGDPEPGASAEVDLDECYSMSEGTPVVFRQDPEGVVIVQENPICKGEKFILEFTASQGEERFHLTFDLGGSVHRVNNLFANDVFELESDSSVVLTLHEIKDLYCTTSKNEALNLVVNVAPEAAISGNYIYCENDGTAPVYLTINTEGEGTLWDIEYTDGTNTYTETGIVDGHQIPVNPAASESAYNYTLVYVDDNSGGNCTGLVSGNASVQVHPKPTATLSGDLEFCEFDSLPHTVSVQEGSGNYRVGWSHSGGESFNRFVSGDSILLFASPEAGSYTYALDSLRDMGTGCLAYLNGQGTANVFPAPKAIIGGIDTLCETQTPTLDIEFSDLFGELPLTLYYSDSIGSHSTTANSLQDFIVNQSGYFNAGTRTTTRFQLDSIRDGSTASCLGFGSGQAILVVNPTPTASLSGDTLICFGDSAVLNIRFTGSETITAQVNSQYDSFSIQGAPGTTESHVVYPDQTDTYQITYVNDANNPSCTGTFSGTATVNVNSIPDGTVQLTPSEICFGETFTALVTTTSSASLQATFSDNYGHEFTELVDVAFGTHQFQIPTAAIVDTGDYVLTLDHLVDQSSAGCSNDYMDTAYAYVNPNPTLAFSLLDSVICAGESSAMVLVPGPDLGPFSAYFVGENGGENLSLLSDSNTFVLTPNQSFQYQVTSVMNTRTGCSTDLQEREDLRVQPNPSFTAHTDSSFCLNQEINLDLNIEGDADFLIRFENNFGEVFTDTLSENTGTFVLPATVVGTHHYDRFYVQELQHPLCVSQTDTTISFVVNDTPPVDFDLSTHQGCSPLGVSFQNQTPPEWIDRVIWDFGDGIRSHQTHVDSLFFAKAGTYTVRLTVITPAGCIGEKVAVDTLEVFANPIADFTFSPNPVTIRTPEVKFENTSVDAAYSFWQFDNLNVSELKHPEFEFPGSDDAIFNISLWVENDHGCVDSITKPLRVEGVLSVNIPNTFTPDEDGINEYFKPIIHGAEEHIYTYDFHIFDRWGIEVFHTSDYETGWDGTKNGERAKSDVYVYRVRVQSNYSAEVQEFMGHVQVLR